MSRIYFISFGNNFNPRQWRVNNSYDYIIIAVMLTLYDLGELIEISSGEINKISSLVFTENI